MPNTIEFLIKADAQLAGLQQTVKSLDQVREKAASAGLSTAALDKELKLTKAAEGARYLELYSKGLQDLIQAEKAAGRQTGDLEKQLAALSQTRIPEPAATWSLGIFWSLVLAHRSFAICNLQFSLPNLQFPAPLATHPP